MDIMGELQGTFFVRFVGDNAHQRLTFSHAVVDSYGRPLWLVGEDRNTIYNWTGISKMTRVEE